LSNAFASDSNGRDAPLSDICWFARARETYQESKQEVIGKHSAEFPNMAQRAVMQCLSLDDWKVAARLPIPAGELMLSRIRNYGWIEIRGEKHRTAIKLTPAGLQAMRSAI
jgi:hypothetical protein